MAWTCFEMKAFNQCVVSGIKPKDSGCHAGYAHTIRSAFQFAGGLQTKFHPLFGTDPLKNKRDLEKKSIFLHWLFFLNYGQCLCAQMKRYTPNDLDSCRNWFTSQQVEELQMNKWTRKGIDKLYLLLNWNEPSALKSHWDVKHICLVLWIYWHHEHS